MLPVQFNADKRYVEFLSDRGNSNKQTEKQDIEVPKAFEERIDTVQLKI
jgi:hypothetical protein